MSSVLDFFGIRSTPKVGGEPSELDQVLTQWILEHSPNSISKAQKRFNKIETPYEAIQNFIAQSVQPFCNPQPEVVQSFDVKAFMGQWFQVKIFKIIFAVSLRGRGGPHQDRRNPTKKNFIFLICIKYF